MLLVGAVVEQTLPEEVVPGGTEQPLVSLFLRVFHTLSPLVAVALPVPFKCAVGMDQTRFFRRLLLLEVVGEVLATVQPQRQTEMAQMVAQVVVVKAMAPQPRREVLGIHPLLAQVRVATEVLASELRGQIMGLAEVAAQVGRGQMVQAQPEVMEVPRTYHQFLEHPLITLAAVVVAHITVELLAWAAAHLPLQIKVVLPMGQHQVLLHQTLRLIQVAEVAEAGVI